MLVMKTRTGKLLVVRCLASTCPGGLLHKAGWASRPRYETSSVITNYHIINQNTFWSPIQHHRDAFIIWDFAVCTNILKGANPSFKGRLTLVCSLTFGHRCKRVSNAASQEGCSGSGNTRTINMKLHSWPWMWTFLSDWWMIYAWHQFVIFQGLHSDIVYYIKFAYFFIWWLHMISGAD